MNIKTMKNRLRRFREGRWGEYDYNLDLSEGNPVNTRHNL